MSVRLCLYFALGCLLTSCTYQPRVPASAAMIKPVTSSRQLADFRNIQVFGHLNVNLQTGYTRPSIIIKGDPRDTVQLISLVSGNNLLVRLPDGYPKFGPVTVDIRGHYLNGFSYTGAGVVKGEHIKSAGLSVFINNPERTVLGGTVYLQKLEVKGQGMVDINGIQAMSLPVTIRGNARVQLSGVVNVAELDLDGNSWLGISWVKSDRLKINARGRAYVQLAGITNRLELELWEHARFNGRYLRVDRVFAKTHQHSVAEISALKRQSTLATDASDIYFYELPEMKTNFMAYKGSVLDMRDLSLPVVEEYTKYNK